MPDELFPDIKAWPDSPLPPSDHNQPPLEDRLTMAFEDTLLRKGLKARVEQIREAAARAPEITDTETAGAVGDLVAQAKAAAKAVDGEREILNRPLLSAQRNLKGMADGLVSPMTDAIAPLKANLDAYMAESEDKVAHGDMGARVGTRTKWEFEVIDYAKLPLAIRRHPEVTAAIDKVVRAHIRGGARNIAGVKIWPAKAATIR